MQRLFGREMKKGMLIGPSIANGMRTTINGRRIVKDRATGERVELVETYIASSHALIRDSNGETRVVGLGTIGPDDDSPAR